MNHGVVLDPTAELLSSTAGIQRVPSPRLSLYIHRNFLDEAACAGLCALIDSNRRPSTLADDEGAELFRTSETCDLDPRHALVGKIQSRLAELTGISLSHAEPLQGQRYAPGQEFRPHTDTFNPGGPDYFIHCADAGQRS